MRELPVRSSLRTLGGTSVHRSSTARRAKVNEYLFEDKPASLYERLASRRGRPARSPFGHTHKPWVREHGGVLFVNCGSVGKPKDGDPRAAFAVLRPPPATDVDVTIERVSLRRRGRSPARSPPPACQSEYAEKLVVAA